MPIMMIDSAKMFKPAPREYVRFLTEDELIEMGARPNEDGLYNFKPLANAYPFTHEMKHLFGCKARVNEIASAEDGSANVSLSEVETGSSSRFGFSAWMLRKYHDVSDGTFSRILSEYKSSHDTTKDIISRVEQNPTKKDQMANALRQAKQVENSYITEVYRAYVAGNVTVENFNKFLEMSCENQAEMDVEAAVVNAKRTAIEAAKARRIAREAACSDAAVAIVQRFRNSQAEGSPALFDREGRVETLYAQFGIDLHRDDMIEAIKSKVLSCFDFSARFPGIPRTQYEAKRLENAILMATEQLEFDERVTVYLSSTVRHTLSKFVYNFVSANFTHMNHPTDGRAGRIIALRRSVCSIDGGTTFNDLVHECTTCGTRHGRGPGQICRACQEQADRNIFHRYHSTPRNYPSSRVGTVLFGIENELHCPTARDNHEAFRIIRDSEGMAIGELDGSLGRYDGEVILNPLPYSNKNTKKVTDFFAKLGTKMRVPHMDESTVSYGLHINVSGFATSVAERAQRFLYANKAEVERLAGRTENSYCYYNRFDSGDKYRAINIRGNGVAEFRIFRATTNHTELMYRLQFAMTVLKFCSVTPTSSENFTWEKYKQYVKAQRRSNELRLYFFPTLKEDLKKKRAEGRIKRDAIKKTEGMALEAA